MIADSTPPSSSTSPSPAASGIESNRPARSGAHRVLVIESDVETADLVASLLESADYDVEVATDGPYGLMLAESFQPELILLGAILQRMNALEVTQTLRSAPGFAQDFRNTPIIYLAENRQLIQQRFHALPGTPMSDYIFKPIDVQELLDKVNKLFAARE